MGLTENRELIIHRFPLSGDQILLLLAVAMEIGYFFPWYRGNSGWVNGFGASMKNVIYFCTMLCPIAIAATVWIDGRKWGREKYSFTMCLSLLYFFLLGRLLTKALGHGDETGKLIWLCLLCSVAGIILSGLSLWFNCEDEKVGQEIMGKSKGEKICSYCSTVLDAEANFCRECGRQCEAQVPEPVREDEVHFCAYCGRKVGSCIQYCVHCGTKLDEQALYCPSCGRKVECGKE